MRLRRPASSQASKATILLIVAVTICCWANAMGALAAKGIDHGLLDGITVAVVALLGAGGGVGWMSKRRSRKTAPKPADAVLQHGQIPHPPYLRQAGRASQARSGGPYSKGNGAPFIAA